MRYIWFIPLLPGIGAAINGLVGIRSFSRKTAGVVACTMMTAALGAVAVRVLAAARAAGRRARLRRDRRRSGFRRFRSQTNNGIGVFQVTWGFRLDPLSGMMILIVTGIGTLIHVYSTAYMADEPRGGVARFFCYLNLFCFFMLMLVLGNNFLVMFVGWEGRRPLLVPADRLLVREEERGGRRQEGVHHQPRRRLGLRPRRLPRSTTPSARSTSAPCRTPRR